MLACDIGNTQTVFGYFKNGVLSGSFRVNTDPKRTGDEYKLLVRGFLSESGLKWDDFSTITLASVVPRATDSISSLGIEKRLIEASHRSALSYKIKVPEPSTVGADRIVNMEAAVKRYSVPFIIVDCGTAVTFDVVNQEGEYIGGAITPGIYTSADALFSHASKLFSTALRKPESVIGNTTKSQLESGIVQGWGSLIDGMIWKMRKEIAAKETKVIGTGGNIELIAKVAASIDTVDKSLTLDGLWEVYRNETGKSKQQET